MPMTSLLGFGFFRIPNHHNHQHPTLQVRGHVFVIWRRGVSMVLVTFQACCIRDMKKTNTRNTWKHFSASCILQSLQLLRKERTCLKISGCCLVQDNGTRAKKKTKGLSTFSCPSFLNMARTPQDYHGCVWPPTPQRRMTRQD